MISGWKRYITNQIIFDQVFGAVTDIDFTLYTFVIKHGWVNNIEGVMKIITAIW